MLSARFHTRQEPFCARLGVMVAVLIALALLLTALPSHAGEKSGVAAARAVIERQIQAFRQDDAAGAYAYAAPSIQDVFPTPALFMQMVRHGYAPVYRPSTYTFDPPRVEVYGRLVQPVRIEWQGGPPVIAIYVLALQPEGEWKIEGVMLSKDDRIRT